MPRFGLHRLRPDVGHDVAAWPRGRRAVGRHRHRGPPLRRRLGDDPVELPHRSVAALPDRGRGDRRHPPAGAGGRDPSRPCARGVCDSGGGRLARRSLPVRRRRRPDHRRRRTATLVENLASGAQRGRCRRPPAHGPGGQRATAAHQSQAVDAPATDLRPGCCRRSDAHGAGHRPALRRARHVLRYGAGSGLERTRVRPMAGRSPRRRVDGDVRRAVTQVRRGWHDPVHGDAGGALPRCPVRGHRCHRSRRQCTRSQRVPAPPDRTADHGGRGAAPRCSPRRDR